MTLTVADQIPWSLHYPAWAFWMLWLLSHRTLLSSVSGPDIELLALYRLPNLLPNSQDSLCDTCQWSHTLSGTPWFPEPESRAFTVPHKLKPLHWPHSDPPTPLHRHAHTRTHTQHTHTHAWRVPHPGKLVEIKFNEKPAQTAGTRHRAQLFFCSFTNFLRIFNFFFVKGHWSIYIWSVF